MNDAVGFQKPCTTSPGCSTCVRTFETCLSWDHLVNAVALRIRQTLELRAILQTTVDEVHQLLGCDRVLLYRFEPDWSGRVVVESVSEPQWSVVDRVVHDPCFESSWLEPYQEKRYFAVEDIAKANLTPCHAEFLASFQVQANLVIPILKENTLWGLLIAHHCQAPRPWQDVEIEGLQLLAMQVGIAIHQAALIDQLKIANTTLEADVAARTRELAQVNQALEAANQKLEDANRTLRAVNQKLIAKIQERNQVAAEVIQREAFLQQVLNSLFAFVGVMTPDGILVESNQALLDMAGLTRDDVIGKPFADAYWWAYSSEAQATIRSAIEAANQGTMTHFDIPVQMQGGQLITIDFALKPLRHPRTGEITHLIPSGVDISDRLQAEGDRTRLLNMLEASLNEIYLFNADTLKFEYVNQGGLRNLGYSLEQLQQMTAVDIKPDLTLPEFETLITPLRRQEVAKMNFESVHQRSDGSRYPVDVHLQLTHHGAESRFLAVILDITERQQATADRLRDQARLQQLGAIVASSQDAIISKTSDGIVTSWNHAAEAIFGYTAAEIIGQPITAIIPPDHRDEAAQILARIRQGQRVKTYETQRRHQDGHLVDVSLTVSPIYGENGAVVGASKIARDITAQKRDERLRQQAESALRASQDRFQRFMDNAPLLSWIVSREGRVEYGNEAWFTFVGQSKTAALGQVIADLFPPEFAQTYRQANQQVLDTGQVVETIEPGTAPDGTLHTFLVRKFPVYTEGQVTAVGGIAIDITDQQQAETLIRDQAETLRIFYDTSPLLMGLVEISDHDILHLSDNPAALSFFGLTAAALANHWASEVGLPAEVIQLWLTHYRQSQQQQRPVQFDYTHITPADQHNLLVTVSFVGQGNDDRPRCSYIVQDLTEKKQLEREKAKAITRLHDSEQRYASLVAAVPVGIFRTDANGHCIYTNQRWEQLAGLTQQEALGEGWAQALYPDDREAVFSTWTQAAQQGRPFELEYRFQSTDGTVSWVYGQAVAEYNAAGDLLGYVGTITDITEHKQIETERQQAQQTEQELSLLEQILNIVLAGYWDWHIADDEEYLSPGFKQMLGYADHELINSPQTWQDLIFPEDLPVVLEQFNRHVQSHGTEPYYNEVRYRHKEGSTVWILCSGQVIDWDDAGNPLRMIGCHIDITQRQQAEESLRQSEATNRALIQAIPDFLVRMRQDGVQIDVINTGNVHCLGLEDEDPIKGHSVLDIMPTDIGQERIHLAQIAISTGQPQKQEYSFTQNHQTYYEEARISPLSDSEVLVMVRDITSRKQAEIQLQNLSTRLTLAVQSAQIGIWEWDVVTDTLLWDDRMLQIYGLAPEDFSGHQQDFKNRLHPDDAATVQAQSEQCLADPKNHSCDIQYRIVWSDGSVHWVQSGAKIQRNEHGEAQRLIGVNFDITSIKQSAQDLKQAKDQLELVLQASSEGFWDWDITTNDVYFSPRWKEMLGYGDHELDNTFEMWDSVIFEADRIAALQLVEDYNSGQVDQFKTVQRFRHKEGSTVFVLSRAIHLKDADGQVVRMVGSHLDISDNKRQELALQESEARYRNIIETTLEGVWILDADSKTTFVNQRMAEMLGYDIETMQHQSFLDFMTPDDQVTAQDYFARRQEGIQEQHSFKFLRQDGSDLWTLISGTPIFDQEGVWQGVIGLLTDITPLINTQEALKQSELQLSGILNSSLDGVMAFRSLRDDQGQIVDFAWTLSNPTACQSVNKPLHELIGQRMLDVLPGNRTDGLFDLYIQVVETGTPVRRQFHYQHDGLDTWFENIAVPLGDGFAVTFRDISAVKASEQALQQVNSAMEVHLRELRQRNDEMLMLSETSDFLQACRTLEEACAVISTLVQPMFPNCSGSFHITCASRNRVEAVVRWGDSLHSLADFQPHDCWALRRGRWHSITPDRQGLYCNHIKDAPPDLVTLCIPMIAQGETLGMFYLSTKRPEGLPLPKQQLARTVAEQVGLAIANLNLRETLQNQSIRDALTGLFNRRYLEESLQAEIARAQRHQYPTAVVMIDVDHFKVFNDTHGHDAGDFVLKAIAQVIGDHIRGSDIACRYGGEELTLVLPETSLIDALAKAEKIRDAIHHLSLSYGGRTLENLTVSLGVAVFPDHGTTGGAVIQSADAALYRAKAAGRNQVITAEGKYEMH
ncbi:PAS domain S-box protein [Leptolyngbya sp. CCY15150]|uniref:PAS domain S-box protein n=1 Tax=Leptolyngbya sp. CCY15150 TaxID=2767772 RepID=UPI00194F2F52|nr:PAS domain S-box protein [Leptolyngbya sp. CCY15150]